MRLGSRSVKRVKHDAANVQPTTEPNPGPIPYTHGPVNTTGLLGLPVDVFARILDELLTGSRQITREDAVCGGEYGIARTSTFVDRADVLRPLSQTCRALRNVYLPTVYEHLDAWVLRSKGQWWQDLGRRLENTCKRFAEEPGSVHANLVQ